MDVCLRNDTPYVSFLEVAIANMIDSVHDRPLFGSEENQSMVRIYKLAERAKN